MATKLERDYQVHVLERLEYTFPGSLVLKNDSSYLQGILDWTIFYGPRWAMLEIKRKRPRPGSSDFQPNQEWYIENLGKMSYCACIFPENEDEVFNEIEQALRPRRKARVPLS